MMKNLIALTGILLLIFGLIVNVTTSIRQESTVKVVMMPVEDLIPSQSVQFANHSTHLLSLAKELSPDVLLLNAFDYVEHYEFLFEYRAVASVPQTYGLKQSPERTYKTPKVGYTDPRISEYYIESNKLWQTFNLIRFNTTDDLTHSLNENLIDYAIVHSGEDTLLKSDSSIYSHLVLMKKDLILSESEGQLSDYFNSYAFEEPDEDALNEVIRWLYSKNLINTRYYYKDLVHLSTP